MGFFVLLNGIALAQGAAQAFGAKGVNGIDGSQAQVWTAQQPSATNNYRASPVFVCTTAPPCLGPLVETGYDKGDNSPVPNVLQQYASYLTTTGVVGGTFGLGNLANNTWYKFMVNAKTNTGKWAILRDDVKVWTTPNIGFFSGSMVGCGAEGGVAGTNIAVQCDSMQYRLSTWYSYDWTFPQISAGYCVDRPAQFEALGWGPC